MLIALYILSIIVSYLLFRQYLIYDRYPECNPFLILIIIMFIPFLNIALSLTILFTDFSVRLNEGFNEKFNYKKIFRIK